MWFWRIELGQLTPWFFSGFWVNSNRTFWHRALDLWFSKLEVSFLEMALYKEVGRQDSIDLTVANIRQIGELIPTLPENGPRMPAIGDEVDAIIGSDPVDVKTMAFILLVEQGPPKARAHAATIRQVDNFRRTWEQYANGPATDGRGKFDTSLDPAIH